MDSLDEILSPLVVLISRLCQADETCRVRVRQWIVPDDLDRSSALEARSDLLGRCLRLLGSVYNCRLKDSVGEMLFAMSDSNGKVVILYHGCFLLTSSFQPLHFPPSLDTEMLLASYIIKA
jgi:hypothetical protein